MTAANQDDQMSRWELLRAAADILDEEGYSSLTRHCRIVADLLEANHLASAREAAREAVIEKAAIVMAGDVWIMDYCRSKARELADAGLLVTEVPA